jgi:hypothetical protein
MRRSHWLRFTYGSLEAWAEAYGITAAYAKECGVKVDSHGVVHVPADLYAKVSGRYRGSK